ncbi:triose-phosphate isomerase [Patescibacteria group bacterium]|nr:triose-phosphate isomerase [Patescibacteria group bacterium]MBU1563741.1 triose-phosphate isomerase [Patescibacteria group bacterium]MBU2068410.1 triose-phosphate isomerase [Patescibacteria group bacterium]
MSKLIIGNWKCNPTSLNETKHLFEVIQRGIVKNKNVEVIICPPFIYLAHLIALVKGGLTFGAQDCFWEQKGAFTGEISPLELKNTGCQYVIIGHSERRKYLQETDEMINKKIKAVLKSRLKPILCVGEETRDTFNSEGKPLNEMSLMVGEQIEKDLANVSAARIRDIVIAYEPIWAIGTGNSCSSDDAMKASLFIRKTLTKLYDRPTAEKAKIVYGGSVNSKNVNEYIKGANMDGVLVGGASLNGSEFVKIYEISSRF